MDFAASITNAQANQSRETVAAARTHIRARLPPGTIMALPTAPSIAPPVEATGEALELFRVRTMRLTCIAGVGGLPQINIPAGTASGGPAGLSFIGWPGATQPGRLGEEILGAHGKGRQRDLRCPRPCGSNKGRQRYCRTEYGGRVPRSGRGGRGSNPATPTNT